MDNDGNLLQTFSSTTTDLRHETQPETESEAEAELKQKPKLIRQWRRGRSKARVINIK